MVKYFLLCHVDKRSTISFLLPFLFGLWERSMLNVYGERWNRRISEKSMQQLVRYNSFWFIVKQFVFSYQSRTKAVLVKDSFFFHSTVLGLPEFHKCFAWQNKIIYRRSCFVTWVELGHHLYPVIIVLKGDRLHAVLLFIRSIGLICHAQRKVDFHCSLERRMISIILMCRCIWYGCTSITLN